MKIRLLGKKMLERLGSFFSGNCKPHNSSQDVFDVSKLPGVEPKVMHGLEFSVAAQVIAKEITCRARIKAHLEYKLPFSDMDPEVQKAHDREINEIADSCLHLSADGASQAIAGPFLIAAYG